MTLILTLKSRMTLTKTLNSAVTLLQGSETPLLIAHPRPDGDTVGSTLALRLALLQLGKRPTVACVHPLPANLAYVPGAEAFISEVPADAVFDLVVAIDMSDLSRTGGMHRDAWRDDVPLLVIDHHETNEQFGTVNLVAPEAAATALIMVEVIEALGVSPEDDIATCLLLGLLTDTRGLRTETTSPAVLRTVSELIEAGGDYLGVMQRTLDAVPYQQMRGWGVALDRLKLEGAGSTAPIAWTVFPLAEKEALDISDQDDLDLGNLLTRVAEAKVIAAFVEMRDGTVKVSMRARPGYNVAQVAYDLGGGGHRQASGCTIDGPLDAAVTRVLTALRTAVDQQSERAADRR
jgi:bifunctional oligoribonuclease and PAP phosphatase NrnA